MLIRLTPKTSQEQPLTKALQKERRDTSSQEKRNKAIGDLGEEQGRFSDSKRTGMKKGALRLFGSKQPHDSELSLLKKEDNMATKRSKKDFIGFILAAEEDAKLAKNFLSKKNSTELHKFFHKEGFTEVSKDHCKDILKAKTKRHAMKQQIAGNPFYDCPPDARY